ncbi:MAG: proton-conducting transporter membrane subunit [Chloroflexota bacterium]|nr:proton-conducting transporter membrane subunit [Chloroflexota bacterium]
MTNELLIALFSLPFLASVGISLLLRRSPGTARVVGLVASGATALCATALLPLAGDDPTLVIQWLPGTGPMAFGLATTSLYAAVVTIWAAFLALLGTTSAETETPPLALAMMLLALAAASVAFLTEHFLARYVALEVVALSIALAPLVELTGDEGGRGFWLVYVILRLGDVGLLTAILILFDASGTLEITPALEAASTLSGARLGWVVFGLVLAGWVKLGNCPLHVWISWGQALSPNTQAWLFATVMPNLGAYLLYRVTPLLSPSAAVQTLLLWLAAGAAMLAALIALTRRDVRSTLVYVAAARGGLLVFAAASGVKAVVWLGLLATTPLQLLLFLAGEAPERGTSSVLGRAAQGLFALAGLTLAATGLLITWWARQAGVALDALFVAEVTVALLGVWAVREATRPRGKEDRGVSLHARWVAMGALGLPALAGVVAFGPLARWLMDTADIAGPQVPTLTTLVGYVVTAPALLLTLILVLVTWQMERRSRIRVHVPGPADGHRIETTYDLQEGLAEAAQALRAVVEVGLFEQLIALSVRVVVDGARVTYRFVEQEGLEGLIRRVVQAVVGLSEAMRRQHTGLLRRNLLWIPLSLILALVVAVTCW